MGFMSNQNWECSICGCEGLKVCVFRHGRFGERCKRPVWQDSHWAHSASVFMEFGLGKHLSTKPKKQPHRANIWILFSASCLQRERSNNEFSSLSLIVTTH